MRQVMIIKAHNIPKKLKNISEKSTILLLNYRRRKKYEQKLLKTANNRPYGQKTIKKTKIEGIINADKKLSLYD